MKRRTGRSRRLHCVDEGGVGEEAAVFDGGIYSRDIHSYDTAGAYIQVADFAVTHLAVGQSYRVARALNQCMWILQKPFIQVRSACQRDGVAFAPGGIAESVENYQCERSVLDLTQSFSFSLQMFALAPIAA